MSKPIILGLTGSIGMGKSTVAAMFAELGVPVFDADAVVHELQGPGGILLPAIEQAFPGTTGPRGVDRSRLANAVFGNGQALLRLEAIVHPEVALRRERFLADHAEAPLVLYDIPLLYERGLEDTVDAVAVVSASPETQRRRVLARSGMSEDRFQQILGLQVPDSEKRARADHIIDTDCTLDATRERVVELVNQITR
jgi:dephospho-CoA kinase